MTLDHHHDDDLSDTDSEDSFWAVDVDSFRWLVSDVNLAWRGLAGMYHRSLAPVYNRVQSMLVDDTVQVTHVLFDLEQRDVRVSLSLGPASHSPLSGRTLGDPVTIMSSTRTTTTTITTQSRTFRCPISARS